MTPGSLRPSQREGQQQLQRKWAEALKSTTPQPWPLPTPRVWLPQSREGLGLWPAHLLPGACHLEAGAQVVQPFPLLMPPQDLQVLPQHLDDLKREGRLGCGVLATRHSGEVTQEPWHWRQGCLWGKQYLSSAGSVPRAQHEGHSPASPLAAQPPGTGSGLPAGCSALTWPGAGVCGQLCPGHLHGPLWEQTEVSRLGARVREEGEGEGTTNLFVAVW